MYPAVLFVLVNAFSRLVMLKRVRVPALDNAAYVVVQQKLADRVPSSAVTSGGTAKP